MDETKTSVEARLQVIEERIVAMEGILMRLEELVNHVLNNPLVKRFVR